MKIDSELLSYMQKFQAHFNEIVPLMEISPSVTNEELIAAIEQSIAENSNLLPKLFGYGKLDSDPNVLI